MNSFAGAGRCVAHGLKKESVRLALFFLGDLKLKVFRTLAFHFTRVLVWMML